MLTITYGEIALRLFLSLVLGAIVGYERETQQRPAGFRTHILVCVGSSLIMIISAYGFGAMTGEGVVNDPARIAAQVVTGVGFLGAGTILRHGSTVTGLTTAASLWIVSGIGLAVGIGFYAGALLATLMVLISLILLRGMEGSFARAKNMRRLWVRGIDKPELLGRISSTFGELCVQIARVDMGTPEYIETFKDNVITIDFLLRLPPRVNSEELLKKVAMQRGVLEAGWEVGTLNEGVFKQHNSN
ncbi:MAG TPA: magnesium transporter MgtC [Firmicutes bacterium]|nr:magnesium transporter MgtC [Bacillota bacterium]